MCSIRCTVHAQYSVSGWLNEPSYFPGFSGCIRLGMRGAVPPFLHTRSRSSSYVKAGAIRLLTCCVIVRVLTWYLCPVYLIIGSSPVHCRSVIMLFLNLQAPRVLYIGQTDRSSPQYIFYIFSQQIYLIFFFLDFLSSSSFIPPQNVVYFLMLSFLVHKYSHFA